MVAFTHCGRSPHARANAGVNTAHRPGGAAPGTCRGGAPGTCRQRRGSRSVDEPVQYTYAELERVDRHPFVDAVEHAREVQLRGQLERGEAEAADAEVGEGLG